MFRGWLAVSEWHAAFDDFIPVPRGSQLISARGRKHHHHLHLHLHLIRANALPQLRPDPSADLCLFRFRGRQIKQTILQNRPDPASVARLY